MRRTEKENLVSLRLLVKLYKGSQQFEFRQHQLGGLERMWLLRNEKGVTLTEVMISVGIVATTTFGFISLYSSTKRTSEKNVHQNSCQGYINAVAARIKGMGSTNTIEPIEAAEWAGAGIGLVIDAADVNAAGDTEPGVQRAIRWPNNGSKATIEEGPPGRYVLHNAHLIHGAINGMLAIYNSNPAAYCGNWTAYNYTPGNIAEKLLPRNADDPASMFGMSNVLPEIQIIPYSRSTGTGSDRAANVIGCPNNLLIVPRGGSRSNNLVSPAQYWGGDMPSVSQANDETTEFFNAGGITGPVLVNGGLRVRIRVSYTDKQNVPQGCEGEIKLEYADDTAIANGRRVVPSGGPAANPIGLVWNAAYANRDATMLNPVTDQFSNVIFKVGYIDEDFEPGVEMFCKDRSWRIEAVGTQLFSGTCTVDGDPVVMSNQSNIDSKVTAFWSTGPTEYRMPQSYYTEVGGQNLGGATPPYVAPDRALNFIPGAVATTYPKSNTNGAWVRCSQLTQCGRAPTVDPATTRISEVNGGRTFRLWQLKYDNINAGCVFNADVAIVDTAGNVTVSNMGTLADPAFPAAGTGGAADNRPNLAFTNINNNTIYYRTCQDRCAAAGTYGCPSVD
ncbi:MAG: hypothetical protein KDD61_00370 [Bdellovibrionales bacterium]|nr:hypothetical protein [Bdellovibrionales bacterium]